MPARRCTCAYCTRFNAAWTSHPGAELVLGGPDAGQARRYRFGTGTADFIFCAKCGVTVAATCETDGGLRGIVNINTLDRVHELDFDRGDSDFEGESRDARLSRRKKHWIGSVRLEGFD